MNRRKLEKLRHELGAMRKGQHKASEFQALAKKMGRRENKTRGREPMWESEPFGDLPPLAIPFHGGRDISPGVQRQLLNLLDDDLDRWEEQLDLEDGDGAENEGDD